MDKRLHTILEFERRIELLRGRVQVGGHRPATRLILAQLLAQASLAELRDLGGDRWRDAAQLAHPAPTVETGAFNHPQHYGLLQRVSVALFSVFKDTALATYSRDIAVRLGDSALTPDVFVGFEAAMREYYLEGPPLLALEIIDSYNPTQESERLGLYLAHKTPEVWWLEPERGCVRQFVLEGQTYTLHTQTEGWLESVAVSELAVSLDGAWQPGWQPLLNVAYRGQVSEWGEKGSSRPPPSEVTEALREELLGGVLEVLAELKDEPDRGGFKADLAFTPRIGLVPTPVTFEEFISWTTEAKFEVSDNKLIIGSERGNFELLGLLLMTFGLIEAFSLLPDEVKGVLRGVN